MTTGRLARAATIVVLFGLLSRVLGYARETALAILFGTGSETDAFVSGLFVVNTVAAVLLYTLVTLVIPVFQEERARQGEDSAWRLVYALSAWVGLGLIVLTALVAVWPAGPAALFALEGERAAELESLLRIMAPALMLQGFSALLTALLQVHRRFAGPAAVGVVFNLGIIIGVLVGGNGAGISAVGWGVTAGAVAQILLQAPQLAGLLRASTARPTLRHSRLGAVALLALPVAGASVLQQINGFTDRLFAGTLEEGRIAALAFANALGSAPRTALLFPLLTPLFPLIAGMMAERREGDALRAFERAAGLLALVAIPLSGLLALYATETVDLAFRYKNFTEDSVTQVAGPLVFYALAVWGNFIGYLLNRTLSAANRARDIMWATVVTVALTIGLDLALIGPMEQSGLALASMIAVYVNAAITLAMLRRRLPALSLGRLGRQQVRLLACGVLGCGAAALLDLPLPTDDRGKVALLALVAAKSAVGLVVFTTAARLLAPAELAEGRRAVRALIPGRRRAA